MQLNNFLQVNGGVGRLNWTQTRYGPEHCPLWRVGCLSKLDSLQVLLCSHLVPSVDNILYGEGEAYSRGEAREAAAHRALTALTAQMAHMAQRYPVYR